PGSPAGRSDPRPRAHQGGDRRDPDRRASRPYLAWRADRFQVARPRRRGSLRRRVRRPPGARDGPRHDPRVLIPLEEIRRARETKLAAIERLGGRVLKVPFDQWWRAIEESRFEGEDGLFVHPVQDDLVMAGNGTIGLEILEDLPDADAVLVPYGGGGLTAGIASAVKALDPRVKVFSVEPETAAPLSASLAAGEPQEVEYRPS